MYRFNSVGRALQRAANTLGAIATGGKLASRGRGGLNPSWSYAPLESGDGTGPLPGQGFPGLETRRAICCRIQRHGVDPQWAMQHFRDAVSAAERLGACPHDRSLVHVHRSQIVIFPK